MQGDVVKVDLGDDKNRGSPQVSPNKQSAETTALRGALLALLGDEGGSLKELYANACSLGSKQEELRGLHAVAGLPSHWDQSCAGTLTTGALPWLDMGSLGRTGQNGEEGKLTFM